ncbi:MAG TPA: serine hydrolase [Terriglobales bacterium]|nr:serine hydrolase [Terriglobales bacterium]
MSLRIALLFVLAAAAPLAARQFQYPTATAPAGAQENKQAILLAKTEARTLALAQDFDGVAGIGVKDLTSGQAWFHNGDEIFPTASTIKVAILLELLHQSDQGTLKLSEEVPIRRALVVGDRELLSDFGDGTTTMSLHDIAATMVALSENSAANILMDRVGIARVNAELRALGIAHTLLRRHMLDLAPARQGLENVSTARDMLALFEAVYRGRALSAAGRREFFDLLEIPDKSGTMLTAGIPDAVPVANKPGWLEGVRCDCGLVFEPRRPYEICVFTTYDQDVAAAQTFIGAVSRLWYQYFHRLALGSEYGRMLPPR